MRCPESAVVAKHQPNSTQGNSQCADNLFTLLDIRALVLVYEHTLAMGSKKESSDLRQVDVDVGVDVGEGVLMIGRCADCV